MASTEEARHKKLLEKITHRGPNAFEVFQNILRENFPAAYEILSHVTYRTIDTNDNESRIPEPSNHQLGNGFANNTTNVLTNNICNINNNNNSYGIQNSEGASTSRQISSTVRALSHQFDERAFIATIRNRPLPGKTHIVEYRKEVTPDLNVTVTPSTQFYGENTSKVGACKLKVTFI